MRTLTSVIFGLTLAVPATAGEVSFSAKPSASKDGEKVKISFAVSGPTDVEVAILNAQSKVVRHLAAGLLGKNAPEPFKKDALAQEVVWDGKDDAGHQVLSPPKEKPAAGGPFRVRVCAGIEPVLDKYLGRNDATLKGTISSLVVGRGGELYILLTDRTRGRSELRVHDRNGKYLRTIMPYPASTPRERTESVGHLIICGERLPLIFVGQGHNLHPLVSGIQQQTMAWNPKGFIVAASSTGSMVEQNPPRYLLAFHPEGGAPEGVSFVGPKILEGHGFSGGDGGTSGNYGLDRLATSLDGEWIYYAQDFALIGKRLRHGVYRLKWTDPKAENLWLGKDAPGAGDDEFNRPAGIAVDAAGRVFVCDHNNNRVKVHSPEGKRLGKFAAEAPAQIAVHPKTGDIFIISTAYEKNAKATLLWYSAWKEREAPQQVASLDAKGFKAIALDPDSSPPRMWTASFGEWSKPDRLEVVTAAGGKLTVGEDLNLFTGLSCPSFLAADPTRDRVVVKEHLSDIEFRGATHWVIGLQDGKLSKLRLPGSDVAVDRDGNLYVTGAVQRGKDWASGILRVGPDGKPLLFSATGANLLECQFRQYGPAMGLRGHCVAPNGDIYILRSVSHGVGSTVDVFGPDGKLKKAGLVAGLGSADCGIGVDARGNVYLGMNVVKDPAKPYPEEFLGKVPAETWWWWDSRKPDRAVPWRYSYTNAYLFHMGSVFKFGPEGGACYGRQVPMDKMPITSPGTELDKAPADAVAYKAGGHDVKIAGAKWEYRGVGIIPKSHDAGGDPNCLCMISHLDVDPYGRVFAPNDFHFAVDMLDAAGNLITRIGSYGNVDDGKAGGEGRGASEATAPKSSEPTARTAPPAPRPIHFAWPCCCDFAEADGKLYVSDSVNRRIVVVRFDAAAAETCDLR